MGCCPKCTVPVWKLIVGVNAGFTHCGVMQGPVCQPCGPVESTLAAGPVTMLLPVEEVTDAAGPCTWANNATEPSRQPKMVIARFTGSSYSRTAQWEPLLLT